MPFEVTLILVLQLAVIAFSLVVLVRIILRGELSEKHLGLGPTRDLHEPKAVYLVAAYLVLGYSFMKLRVSSQSAFELQFAVELVPFVVIGLLLGRARRAEAGFRKIGLLPRHPKRDLGWGLMGGVVGFGLAGLAGLLSVNLLTLFDEPAPEVAHETLVTLQQDFNFNLLMMVIIQAVIMAPLIEELVFRGALQTALMRLMKGKRWLAMLITAAAFSAIHGTVVPTQGLLPLFVLGLVFSYVYERTGSLLVPILAHAVFNAANIAIAMISI
jgi:membrane protease YdiL (CAAX protease family)